MFSSSSSFANTFTKQLVSQKNSKTSKLMLWSNWEICFGQLITVVQMILDVTTDKHVFPFVAALEFVITM